MDIKEMNKNFKKYGCFKKPSFFKYIRRFFGKFLPKKPQCACGRGDCFDCQDIIV
ncbi:MAG: hypothetical protein FWD58_08835 [Firmicutes bacterium]|nr:hypothetical protein [Bacillota bacterium]